MKFSYWVAYVVYRRQRGGLARMLNRMAWVNVALGLAAVLVAIFVLRGFRKEVSERLHAFMGHVQVRPYTLPNTAERATIDLRRGLYQAYVRGQLQELVFLQPYALQAALLKTPERVMGLQFKGLGSPYPAAGGLPNLQQGRMIQLDEDGYAKECVLSTKVAEELDLSVGDSLVVHFLKNPPQYRKLALVGLYRTALEELDARLILGDLRLLQHLHGWKPTVAEGLEVFLPPKSDIQAKIWGLFDQVDYGMQVLSVAEDYPQIFDWFALLDRNTYIFLILIVVVAGFNMWALCMILIMERQAMIATLRVLGASRGWVQGVFFFHALIWVIWGMIWGNALAFGLAFLQNQYHILSLDAENYAVDYVPVYIEEDLWLYTNLGFLLWLCLSLGLALRNTAQKNLWVMLNTR